MNLDVSPAPFRPATTILVALLLVVLGLTACADEAGVEHRPGQQDTGHVDTGYVDTGLADVQEPDSVEPPIASCDDGALNGQETDIDCGGSQCEPCVVGSVCQSSRDCDTGVCRQGVCAPSTCDDGIVNGQETDIDCGGPQCGPCQTGRTCEANGDCISDECVDGACYLPSCDDVTCGAEELCYRGTCYPTCDGVQTCQEGSRCFEGHCAPFECEGVPCHAEEFCVRGVCYPPCGAGEDEPCPTLDLVTEEAAQVSADSATLRATIIELPIEAVSEHGFCWHTSSGPSHQAGACESLGGVGQLGGFAHGVEGLTSGRTYYVRAFVIDQSDTFYANEISFTTGAPAPTAVTASQGTYEDYVEVSWSEAIGATAYVVYRDGEEIASVGGATFSIQDEGAAAGSLPGAPGAASATSGDYSDRVELTWSAASEGGGAAHHEYTVTAVYAGLTSSPSAPATGFRASSPVTAYELQIDGGVWFDVGLALSYGDTGAPAGTIEPGTASASSGEYASRVALELTGASKSNGEPVSYRVRALSALGTGPASAPTTGYRGVGELTYQWQRSAGDSDGGFTELAGATGLTHDDTTAPNDGTGRYYRSRVSADGATSQNSIAARGFRAVAAIVSTESVADIGASSATLHGNLGSLGTPTATIHGFCYGTSPAPSTDDVGGTTCQSLGAPSQSGAFSYSASSLVPGSTYYVRAYATNNAGTAYGDDISFVTPPAAPTGVSATNGTSPNYVRVSWNSAAGADEYRVFRDGVLIATVNSTAYDDTDAGTGGLPQAATLTATAGAHTDRVALEWNTPTAANGATHTYTVEAVKNGVAGAASPSDTGYRSPYPITDYELQIDGGSWSSLGQTSSHDDTDAPQGSVAAGTAEASDGEHSAHVALTLIGAGSVDGASRTYRVRALSAAGVGAASSPASGYRSVGSLKIQWQRSAADSDAAYTDIGGTSADYDDTGAPANGDGRYYRANVTAAGAESRLSNAVRGFRAALPVVLTLAPTIDGAQVTFRGDLTSLGAPNPTAHGFCWGTSSNPDVQEQGDTLCLDLGGTAQTGEFSAQPNQWTPNTTYYVRAFATTNAGTTYGSNQTFEVEWTGLREFSTCAKIGRLGPSQAECNTAYSGTTLAGEVTLNTGIQRWIVPATGTYRIEAAGAKGQGVNGGNGARMRGDFQLQQGQVIHILVGQRGTQSTNNDDYGGGGGGSFVAMSDDTPLIVAAGGNSGINQNCGNPGLADIGNGQGGSSRSLNKTGGGGGFFTNGQSTDDSHGTAYVNGGAGGKLHANSVEGGFGGGGSTGYHGSGTGGGYEGAEGEQNSGSICGDHLEWAKSYNDGTNQDNESAVNSGAGYVTIDLM